MAVAELVFLGAAGDDPDESLRLDGDVLEVGAILPLKRCRSPWNARRAVQRVIVGCLAARSDVFLEGPGICPEHLRFYIPAELTVGQEFQIRPMKESVTWFNGALLEELAWITVRGGEEIGLGPWRFELRIGEESPP
jgi:hypothetical protein